MKIPVKKKNAAPLQNHAVISHYDEMQRLQGSKQAGGGEQGEAGKDTLGSLVLPSCRGHREEGG